MIKNINAAYGDCVHFENVLELEQAIKGCGYEIPEDGLQEGRDYVTVYGIYTVGNLFLYQTQSAYVIQGDQYEAAAVDNSGKSYTIRWDTTEEYRKSEEAARYAGCQENGWDLPGCTYFDPETEDPDAFSSFCEDERNACDWENPSEVVDQYGDRVTFMLVADTVTGVYQVKGFEEDEDVTENEHSFLMRLEPWKMESSLPVKLVLSCTK